MIRNNILAYSGSVYYGVEYDASCPTSGQIDHNVFWSDPGGDVDSQKCAGVTVGTNQHADPLFVDYANRDLHLQVGSPAIDYGSPTFVSPAFDGTPRPQGAGPDAGAYER